jgi:hypothetical protein
LKEEGKGKQQFVLWFEITVTKVFTEKDSIINKLIFNLSEVQKKFVGSVPLVKLFDELWVTYLKILLIF